LSNLPGLIFPQGVDSPIVQDANFRADKAYRARTDLQIRTLQATVLEGVIVVPASVNTIGDSVYTGAASLLSASQWVPFDTSQSTNGFPITLPAPNAPPMSITLTDVGFAADTKPVLLKSTSWPIYNPIGPNIGQLTQSLSLNVAGGSFTFALVPNAPRYGTFWMPVGDTNLPSFGGTYTGAFNLEVAISQWVPFDTSLSSSGFPITLPSLPLLPLQIALSDVGFMANAKPVTVTGAGGLKVWNPTGPNARTKQSTWKFDVSGATYVFNLVPQNGANPPFWMPV
jgi:hypothetical protein